MPEKRGGLLLASPMMREGYFAQGVIAMIEHNDEGAFGLVVNQPMPLLLADAWSGLSETPCPRPETPVLRGGPVQGPLVALHGQASHAEQTICDGLHFCSAVEHVSALVEQNTPAMFFAGYAGWGPKQLEEELKSQSWICGPEMGPWLLDEDCQDEGFWLKCLGMADPTLALLAQNPHILPEDPSMN